MKVNFRSPDHTLIFNALSAYPGLTRADLAEILFTGPAGGPEHLSVISNRIARMRPVLAKHGLTIVGVKCPGGYYIRRIDE